MTIPQVAALLPEYNAFVADLATQCAAGTLTDWSPFKQAVLNFFTPSMMDKADRVVPGWHEMAICADHQTLHHVTSVLVALRLSPIYQQATPHEQDSLLWMVLFHDVAKIARPGKHDYIHAFRSAAIAGKALARAGFSVRSGYSEQIVEWFALTYNAISWRPDLQEFIQDNRQLPAILSGLDQLYEPPAIAVIKAVLFHLSIITDPDYPIHAPLTDEEIIKYIDAATFPLLKAMMLVDTDGWNLFDPAEAHRFRQQTQATFHQIAIQIGL